VFQPGVVSALAGVELDEDDGAAVAELVPATGDAFGPGLSPVRENWI
jgi:hypothetical protein